MNRVVVLLFVVSAFLPTPAYACSGWLDCTFGWTERTEVRNSAAIERERIQAESAEQIANIEAQAAERVRQADAEVERVRQMQFQNEADRDIAIAQANAKAEEYKAMIAGLTERTTADIRASADTQIAALQGQAQIAVAGITEAGSTERWRIGGGWVFSIVAVIIVGTLLALGIYRQPARHPMVIQMIPEDRINGYLPSNDRILMATRRQRQNEVIHYEE